MKLEKSKRIGVILPIKWTLNQRLKRTLNPRGIRNLYFHVFLSIKTEKDLKYAQIAVEYTSSMTHI